MKDTGTIVRAMAVLRVVAEADGLVAVKDIAQSLALPMSTSHRLLELLIGSGLIRKNQSHRRYGIGAEFFRLANLISTKTSMASLVQPALDELSAETGETTIFSEYLPAEFKMTYAAKCDSQHTLRFRITLNERIPLEWGASGLAILAFLPEATQAQVLARAEPSPVNMKRLTDDAFFQRLETVRRDGFAISESEQLPDSVGVAAPIYTAQDTVVGSIVLTIPKTRFDTERTPTLVGLVQRVASAFSASARPQSAV